MLRSLVLSSARFLLLCFFSLLLTLMALNRDASAAAAHELATIPSDVASDEFTVTVNGQHTPVMHAVGNYYLLNFDLVAPAQITVTAKDPHYWDAGVEVQPMRWGIRPHRYGASISFPLGGPAKLSITRPGDHFGDSEMLFLFANAPDISGITSQTPNIRYYGPGVHYENIDARSGDNIYLADGAVVFGSLNIWRVHDVRVFGRGTILYDGPQDPNHDQGWIHKRNWHFIVMDNASNIEINGITGIVRSRTWMVQMRDSRGITFHNVKIVGGSPGNANQDGMDWLGGGNTIVQDCFIRAADDIFAMYGNWDGYGKTALNTPGHEVSNITIENSVLSTSISNVVRVGWPEKIFDSHNFTLRDTDVIHMGVGACVVPFSLFELWADPGGKGHHSGYHFQDIRLEDWYSLVQIRQPNPWVRDVTFSNIAAMEGQGMVASELKGDISGVTFRGVNVGSGDVQKNNEVPLDVRDGAEVPRYESGSLETSYTYSPGQLRPNSQVMFIAKDQRGDMRHYRWFFGDGTTAEGPKAIHAFPDSEGTLLDGSGRFRVLLSVSDDGGHHTWSSQSVVVSPFLVAADTLKANRALSPGLAKEARPAPRYEGFLNIPADGGYTLTLLTSTTSMLIVDGRRAKSQTLRQQVCGSPGSAIQPIRLSMALARGLHSIQVQLGPEIENAGSSTQPPTHPVLLWEGPGILQQTVPQEAFTHEDKLGDIK